MGYFKIERLRQIHQADAFFLSRLKFDVAVYQLINDEFKPLDLLKLQRKMKPGERITLSVYIGNKEKLPVRMIIEKVPLAVAAEKRRKLKTDKQNKRKSLSAKRLSLCDINAYVTNTTEEQLPVEQVRNYYSLRWQIEIIFKGWKSVYRIDKIKPMKIERFECIHYGVLFLIVLTTHLLAYGRRYLFKTKENELSELKTFKTLKSLIQELQTAVSGTQKTIFEFLNLFEAAICKTCVKQKKKMKLTPLLIIKTTS